jgi:hypothetical protein
MMDLKRQLETTETTIKALQDYAESLRGMMGKKTPKKWSPVGGEFFVCTDGNVYEGHTEKEMRLFGLERPTEQQAERAAVEMRKFNRLLALRDELCGDDAVDWNTREAKYFLCHNEESKTWDINTSFCQNNNTVYFTTLESAQLACDMLNSGEVEL